MRPSASIQSSVVNLQFDVALGVVLGKLLTTTILGLNSALQVMTLVALGFERRAMTRCTGVVIADTHHRVGGILGAFTRRGVVVRFFVFGQSHATILTAANCQTVVP